MASSSRSKKKSSVYDPIRALWVAAHPEELVRQRLIQQMIGPLGYPRAYLAVEKELKELPHLTKRANIPERRVDLLAFAPVRAFEGELSPLLLVECKEKSADEEALRQLWGYNNYIGAPFLALVDEEGVRFYYETQNGRQELGFLPTYKELIDALRGNA